MKAQDLRNSILQMAVQGKLVPQDPSEEPAAVLLERIREERQRLIAEGKLKAPKGGESVIYRASDGSHYEKRIDAKGRESEPVCIDDEIPFEIPESWEWARLYSLAWFGGGKTPPTNDKSLYSENGVLWVTSKDMKRDVVDSTLITLSDKGASLLDIYPAGSIVMVTRSGILKRLLPVAVLAKEATVNQDQKVTIPFNESGALWLPIVFRSADSYIRSEFGKAGTTVESVNFEQVKQMLIPVPSVDEQNKISKKLGSLWPLIAQYDALETAREKLDAELPERLRKSILQMAVQGRLVPQDPADEPASALLERIREERRKLIAEGKLKAPKGGESVIYRASDGGYYEKRVDAKGRESEPVCIDDEIPFNIPESWEWARLPMLVELGIGKTPSRHEMDYWLNGSVPWVSISDMVDRDEILSTKEKVSEMAIETCFKEKTIPAGTLLMSFKLTIGKMSILGFDGVHNEAIVHLRPFFDLATRFRDYLMWVLPLFALKGETKDAIKGTTLNKESMNRILIPLPPLEEQRKIVEIVRRIFQLTNQ